MSSQGLTAHLSQAGEDAKRVARNFFSNQSNSVNTVCTIKSAPARNPAVLNVLATRSGWLYKRNEQHVWQARWCCVVPHTFLYYFDRSPTLPPPPPVKSGAPEEWNTAIRTGYDDYPTSSSSAAQRRHHEKRFGGFFPSTTTTTDTAATAAQAPATDEDDEAANNPEATQLTPAGIIDLECYTAIRRSATNGQILELAGDDDLNPDLRPFYFYVPEDEQQETGDETTTTEEWMSALLNQRHAALIDECDAYKQVCEGFAQQLQLLHSELDDAVKGREDTHDELYAVRSAQEDARRQVVKWAEEIATDGSRIGSAGPVEQLRQGLDHVRAQGMGVVPTVQLLSEYARQVGTVCGSLQETVRQLETDIHQNGQSDQARVSQLEQEVVQMRESHEHAQTSWQKKQQQLQTALQASKQELDTVRKALENTQMEMNMHGSQQKNTLKELQQHKKILKREVIELRTGKDALARELSDMKHAKQQEELKAQQEATKSALLEKYVDKIESQVKVQQNMMELMSQSGIASVAFGGSVCDNDSRAGSSSSRRRSTRSVARSPRAAAPEEKEEADDVIVEGEAAVVVTAQEPQQRLHLPQRPRRGFNIDADLDNKSHMSELTEDRTQRHFETMHREFYTRATVPSAPNEDRSPRLKQKQRNRKTQARYPSPRNNGPPSYIIGGENSSDNEKDDETPRRRHLDTIAHSVGPPRHPSSTSVVSERRSVAQRARMEADEKSQSIKVNGKSLPPSPQQSGGLLRKLGGAVLRVARSSDDDHHSDTDDQSIDERSSSQSSLHSQDLTEESGTSPPGQSGDDATSNEEKKVETMSLQERSQLQRVKQMQFLRDQGLLRKSEELKGGATDALSVTSSRRSGLS